jgi:hypothetical protein
MASEYKYVPVLRLALYVEESLYRGSKWIVFEPNDERLWAQSRLDVGAFMSSCSARARFRAAARGKHTGEVRHGDHQAG